MFIKSFNFFFTKIVEPIGGFFAGILDEREDEKSKFINPICWFGVAGLNILYVIVCFSQIFVYSYYWTLLAIYRTKVDDHNDRIQWCKDNNLRCYDFKPFYDDAVLLFTNKQIHFIGFRKKKDAIYFKINQEL